MLYNSTCTKFMSSQIHRHRKETVQFLHTPGQGNGRLLLKDYTASVLQDGDNRRIDDGDASSESMYH